MLKITRKKGFHITFDNGYTVSVQFGWANYCDNYDFMEGENHDDTRQEKAGEKGSKNAECAVFCPNGELIILPEELSDGNTVTNRTSANDVLNLMNWAAKL